MRSSFSMREKRTWPSPYSPKPMPGLTATLASLSRSFRELERAEVPVRLGDFGPDEHGGLRRRHVPAALVQAFDEDVAAAAVVFADLGDAFLRAFEREDAAHLDGREGAVVEVALESGEGGDEVGVADHEADAPAGHVVALRQGEELDGDVFGAGDFEDGGRR